MEKMCGWKCQWLRQYSRKCLTQVSYWAEHRWPVAQLLSYPSIPWAASRKSLSTVGMGRQVPLGKRWGSFSRWLGLRIPICLASFPSELYKHTTPSAKCPLFPLSLHRVHLSAPPQHLSPQPHDCQVLQWCLLLFDSFEPKQEARVPFLMVLGFELRASCLLGRWFTTWAISPPLELLLQP
jgi:hypothetical protein